MKPKINKIREQLILDNLYLVHTIVNKIQKKLNYIYSTDDLISIGTIGLINAVDNYNTTFNVKMSTFANRRIYGAILDYLRTEDYLSRSNRTKLKRIEKVVQYLEHELGREAYSEEIAKRLNIPLEEYYQHQMETDFITKEDVANFTDTSIQQDEFYMPDNEIHFNQFIEKLSEKILSCSDKERLIFCLYFYEDLPQSEIGEILNLQEARICQLLRKTILTIKVDIELRKWFSS